MKYKLLILFFSFWGIGKSVAQSFSQDSLMIAGLLSPEHKIFEFSFLQINTPHRFYTIKELKPKVYADTLKRYLQWAYKEKIHTDSLATRLERKYPLPERIDANDTVLVLRVQFVDTLVGLYREFWHKQSKNGGNIQTYDEKHQKEQIKQANKDLKDIVKDWEQRQGKEHKQYLQIGKIKGKAVLLSVTKGEYINRLLNYVRKAQDEHIGATDSAALRTCLDRALDNLLEYRDTKGFVAWKNQLEHCFLLVYPQLYTKKETNEISNVVSSITEKTTSEESEKKSEIVSPSEKNNSKDFWQYQVEDCNDLYEKKDTATLFNLLIENAKACESWKKQKGKIAADKAQYALMLNRLSACLLLLIEVEPEWEKFCTGARGEINPKWEKYFEAKSTSNNSVYLKTLEEKLPNLADMIKAKYEEVKKFKDWRNQITDLILEESFDEKGEEIKIDNPYLKGCYATMLAQTPEDRLKSLVTLYKQAYVEADIDYYIQVKDIADKYTNKNVAELKIKGELKSLSLKGLSAFGKDYATALEKSLKREKLPAYDQYTQQELRKSFKAALLKKHNE